MSRVADGAATRPISCVAIGRPVHALRAAGLRFWSEEEKEGKGGRCALPISPNMTPAPTNSSPYFPGNRLLGARIAALGRNVRGNNWSVLWVFFVFFLRMARATGGVVRGGIGKGDLLRAVGGERLRICDGCCD